jgi:hypothetical protein
MKKPPINDYRIKDYIDHLEDQIYNLKRQLAATEECQPIEVRIAKIIEDLGFKRS